MKKTLFILILAGLSALGYSQMLGGLVQVGGGSLTPQNLYNEGQSSINFNNIFGFPDSLQIAAWAHETTSRTIYVATTGNDVTGTGAVGAPYATVGKALSTINKVIDTGVTVTISIGAGTFTVSADDLTVLSSISGAGTLTIQGTLTLVESGFTMGSADANDPLTYAVSGGNTASWTTNQYQFYFLKASGGSYIPVTHNTSSSLSISFPVTGTEIYQAQSILSFSMPSNYILTFNCSVHFKELSFVNANAFQINSSTNCMYFTSVYFNFTTVKSITIGYTNSTTAQHQFYYCCFNNAIITINSTGRLSRGWYMKGNINTGLLTIQCPQQVIASAVFENGNTGTSSCGITTTIRYPSNIIITGKLKFINSDCGFAYNLSTFFNLTEVDNIILSNTKYLIRRYGSTMNDYSPLNFVYPFSKILGTPSTGYIYNSNYEFVNLSSGRNIQITGLIYPEFEQNLTATLADNATTNVIIGNKLQNRSIVLDYTIKRGATYEVGRIKVLNDGTNLTIQEDTPLGDVGVTFAVDYNTNEIRLNCALTSTGTGATIYYNAQRVMITPLTL